MSSAVCACPPVRRAAAVFAFSARVSFSSGRIPHCLGETARLRRFFCAIFGRTTGLQPSSRSRFLRAFFQGFVLEDILFLRERRAASAISAKCSPITTPSSASRCRRQSLRRFSALRAQGTHISSRLREIVNATHFICFISRKGQQTLAAAPESPRRPGSTAQIQSRSKRPSRSSSTLPEPRSRP